MATVGINEAAAPRKAVAAGEPEKQVCFAFLGVGLLAMFIGFLLGPPQALNYAGINVYQYLPLSSYYQGLTLHGVLMALVFTSYFIAGLLIYLPARELRRRPNMGLSWTAFGMMTVGTALAGGAMLADSSNVLYTLYPPLEGHWTFYLGLALVVVATLVAAVVTLAMRQAFKRANPDQPTPLVTYMSVVTWIMWAIASLGVAVGVVVLLLPASLGWVEGTDPQLFRTLFWFTGHPIVYFWLLPAYIAWYAMIPHRAGGKLFSDPMVRLVFLLFLVFSIPVGFHHQYSDPGIGVAWKLVHNITTGFVAIPSLITAFTVAASLEIAGRNNGGRGWLGWIPALPWRDPFVTASFLAMVTFIFGGAGGIVLSSFNLNVLVHNTAFIPGHFHITVGTAVTMTFMGLAFVLIPHLTRRRLLWRRTALTSVWCWFVGMMLFAVGMHWQGILSVPRRSHISSLPDSLAETYAHAATPAAITGLSAVVLLVAGVLFFYVLIATLLQRREPQAVVPRVAFGQALSGSHNSDGEPKRMVMTMDRLLPWTFLAIALILVAYAPTIISQIADYTPVSGRQLW
jgi:cytochrome c oxidase subunit 1